MSNVDVLAALQKAAGKEYLLKEARPTLFIPTGIPTLDWVLGTPGIACGRTTIIRGAYSSGKSSLAYQIMAQAQAMGAMVALIETEYAVDRQWAERFGVDLDKVVLRQPPTLQVGIQLIDAMLATMEKLGPEHPLLIVWDTISQTAVDAEVKTDGSTVQVASHSRILSAWMRRIPFRLQHLQTALLLVNQTRQHIPVGYSPGGSRPTTTMIGETPLAYAASQMVLVEQGPKIRPDEKHSSHPTGVVMNFTVEKNKLAPPFRRGKVELNFDGSFNLVDAWFRMGEELDLFVRTGSWYTYKGRDTEGNEKEFKFQSTKFAGILAETDLIARINAEMEQRRHLEAVPLVDPEPGEEPALDA